jgi:hypothetical protein
MRDVNLKVWDVMNVHIVEYTPVVMIAEHILVVLILLALYFVYMAVLVMTVMDQHVIHRYQPPPPLVPLLLVADRRRVTPVPSFVAMRDVNLKVWDVMNVHIVEYTPVVMIAEHILVVITFLLVL